MLSSFRQCHIDTQMLFQLFCTLSARCQITSAGSRARLSLHLSGIFPDREKKGVWDSRTREGLGLNEYFKCWNQVIRQTQSETRSVLLDRRCFPMDGFQQIVRARLYIWIPGLVLCMESKRKKENIKCLQTEFILHSGLLGNVLQSAARCQIHDRKIFCIASAYWCSRQYRAKSRGLDRWCEHNASLDPCTGEHKPKCGMQNILKQCISHFRVLVLKKKKRKKEKEIA